MTSASEAYYETTRVLQVRVAGMGWSVCHPGWFRPLGAIGAMFLRWQYPSVVLLRLSWIASGTNVAARFGVCKRKTQTAFVRH